MKKFICLILFALKLFSFDENLYSYDINNYVYSNYFFINENSSINYVKEKHSFDFKLDFKYKYIETNMVNFSQYQIDNIKLSEPYSFEITGFFISFKTIF